MQCNTFVFFFVFFLSILREIFDKILNKIHCNTSGLLKVNSKTAKKNGVKFKGNGNEH